MSNETVLKPQRGALRAPRWGFKFTPTAPSQGRCPWLWQVAALSFDLEALDRRLQKDINEVSSPALA
jgi:hypothetical protein